MIDFHCHIDLYSDPAAVVAHCEQQGFYVLSVTTTPSAWRITASLAKGCARIRTAIGLHPQLAAKRASELRLFDEVLPGTRYVGEIGLDGSPELADSWSKQMEVFAYILRSCERVGGRIMSIHSRRASTEVLDHLEQHPAAGVPVLHWYSGSKKELIRAVDLGCWFSIGPAMLWSRSGQILVSMIPKERVLTETDGPFVQLNGLPLQPGDTGEVVSFLSTEWGTTGEATIGMLSDNLTRLVTRWT